MLKISKLIPSAQKAAYESLPEREMAGQRFNLAETLLRDHCPGQLLAFMFEFDQAAAACQVLYPEVRVPNSEEAATGSPVTSR